MNTFLRITLFTWILFCAVFAWIGCAFMGFIFAFSNWYFLYTISPFIGLTFVICIMKCAMYVLRKSDPLAYIDGKLDALERLLGKEKI